MVRMPPPTSINKLVWAAMRWMTGRLVVRPVLAPSRSTRWRWVGPRPLKLADGAQGVRVVYRHLIVIPLVQADRLAAEKVNGGKSIISPFPLTEGFQDRQPTVPLFSG